MIETSGNQPEIIRAAKEIHTEVYLEKGFISNGELATHGPDLGLYTDEYSDRSTYVMAGNGRRLAVSRYIKAEGDLPLESLPTLKHFNIDHTKLADVAGRTDDLYDLRSDQIIELSGLASRNLSPAVPSKYNKLHPTYFLYAGLLREGLEQGHVLWVMNTDQHIIKALQNLLGEDQIVEVGEEKAYVGSPTTPIAVNTLSVAESVLTDRSLAGRMKRGYLKRVLDGMNGDNLPDDLRALMIKHGINLSGEQESSSNWLKRHRRALAYTAILAYSSARVLPVGAVEEFDGDLATLWGIDVGTAIPYTWGVMEATTADNPKRRLTGAATAVGCFTAPYAYLWANGEDYPPYVNVAVAGMIGATACWEGYKYHKVRRADNLDPLV